MIAGREARPEDGSVLWRGTRAVAGDFKHALLRGDPVRCALVAEITGDALETVVRHRGHSTSRGSEVMHLEALAQ